MGNAKWEDSDKTAWINRLNSVFPFRKYRKVPNHETLIIWTYTISAIWCTKRVKTTKTGRPIINIGALFNFSGEPVSFTGRPVNFNGGPLIYR